MSKTNGANGTDPVPAIREAVAKGRIAEIYADIRLTLGVPVVNLIWRHLATIDGGLQHVWTMLKPLYVSGAVEVQADALNKLLDMPVLPGLSHETLEGIGLSSEDLRAINTVIASYERSNARNLIAMGTLLAELENLSNDFEPSASNTTNIKPVQGEMPALPALADMPASVRKLVDDMNSLGRRESVMPTMYRHLSHWPAFLEQLYVLLKPLEDDGRLEQMIITASNEGLKRGSALRPHLNKPATVIQPAVAEELRSSIKLFIDEPISKMTAIGGLVAAAMPR